MSTKNPINYFKEKSQLKYLPSGLLGAQVPSYLLSLAITGNPLKALAFHGLNTAARTILAIGGATIERRFVYFLTPEALGYVIGASIHVVIDRKIERSKKQKLEKSVQAEAK